MAPVGEEAASRPWKGETTQVAPRRSRTINRDTHPEYTPIPTKWVLQAPVKTQRISVRSIRSTWTSIPNRSLPDATTLGANFGAAVNAEARC